MQVIKDKLRSAIIASVLTTLIFLKFIPLQGFWCYTILAISDTIETGVCILDELIVTHIFRLPNDATRGYQYLNKRNVFYAGFNIMVQSVVQAVIFNITIPDENYFEIDKFVYILLCFLCASLFLSLYWRNVSKTRFLDKELENALLLNGILQERECHRKSAVPIEAKGNESSETKSAEPKTSVLLTGTTSESLDICIDELLYIESQANYVAVHYLKDGEHCRNEIRNKLTAMSEQLLPYPQVMRCHRAYIVNLQHVRSVERRTNGLMLKLHYDGIQVPVSKSYQVEVKQRIQDIG